jgi:AcrR family transcriptional regulator
MPSREEKKAATRKKLLDAAASLVAKEGALATSLDAIAEKAGLTKGAVYSNFSSKDELLESLADRAGPTVDFATIWDDDAMLADNLEALGRAAANELQSVSRRAWQLGLELFHYALRDPRMRRRYASEQQRGHEDGVRFFAAAIEAHGERTTLSPAEIEVVVNALALGLAQRRAINPALVPDELFAKSFRLLAS